VPYSTNSSLEAEALSKCMGLLTEIINTYQGYE